MYLFRTVTNMFIMNLAAADLLVLVFCLPATVIQDVTKTWFFGLILCKFVNYIQVLFFISNISIHLMIILYSHEHEMISMTSSVLIEPLFFLIEWNNTKKIKKEREGKSSFSSGFYRSSSIRLF
jgi:hypothetical protein